MESNEHSDDQTDPTGSRIVEYDSIRRRLWILGQRCHHGATGSVVAALACAGWSPSHSSCTASRRSRR